MISELWSSFVSASSDRIIVLRGEQPVRACALRLAARDVRDALANGRGPVFLYSEDAANFLSGLIGALMAGRDVLLPAHSAPAYLKELGAEGEALMSDEATLGPGIKLGVKDGISGTCDFPQTLDGNIGFFTSGSSAEPKLCMKPLHQLAAEVHTLRTLWGASATSVTGTVSQQHIYGFLFRILWPLASGWPIVSERQDNWESVDAHLSAGGILVTSPSHLSRIPENFVLSHRPQMIFSSGAALSADVAHEAARKLEQCPIEVLGSTETGGIAWRIQDRHSAIWTAFPDVEVMADGEGALNMCSPARAMPDFISTGDQVSFSSPDHFSLYGRLNRIVKIEGKRVSLLRVEEALAALPEIKEVSAVDLPERNGALGAIVVLAAEGDKKLQSLGTFRFSRLLRKALAQRLEPMELPRFWRFVVQMPENAQGKRSVSELRLLFAQNAPELPTIVARHMDAFEARFDMELMPELRWFDGHFEDQPIFPGVAQLHVASRLAEDVWGTPFSGQAMARIKFKRVMQPGERVTLLLSRPNSERLDFKFLRDDEIVSSGTLEAKT